MHNRTRIKYHTERTDNGGNYNRDVLAFFDRGNFILVEEVYFIVHVYFGNGEEAVE